MKKNMYSLMLSEDVVAEIDMLASQAGTTRSGLINSILAKYVSYRTPEMRMSDMFELISSRILKAGGPSAMLRTSDSIFNLRSMLAYKYNPAVNYSVELYRITKYAVGEIRVSLRTQSSSLKYYLESFFELWAATERRYNGETDSATEGGKFIKRLIIPNGSELSEEELCGEISDYITAFDKALKVFFSRLDDAEQAVRAVNEIYLSYYNGCIAAI